MFQPLASTTLTSEEMSGIQRLLLISLLLILVAGFAAYRARLRNDPGLTVKEFLGLNANYLLTERGRMIILVGMIGGIIFGIIDNAGLWFGLSALEPLFIKKLGVAPGSNEMAAFGNLFSDGLGAFLGTFAGVIMSEYTGIELDESPIWVDAIGVIIGCYIGILIGRMSSK